MTWRLWTWLVLVVIASAILIAAFGHPELIVWLVLSGAGALVTGRQIWLARRAVQRLKERQINSAVLGEARSGQTIQVLIGVMQLIMILIALASLFVERIVVYGLLMLPALLATLSLYYTYITEKGIEEARRRQQ